MGTDHNLEDLRKLSAKFLPKRRPLRNITRKKRSALASTFLPTDQFLVSSAYNMLLSHMYNLDTIAVMNSKSPIFNNSSAATI
jgi:hypothetical protein